jgi:hypothetical protein
MLTELVVIGLAAWRLALFLTDDVGPFGVMNGVRRLLRADVEVAREKALQEVNRGRVIAGYATAYDGPIAIEPNGWEKLWSCMRCMTAWTGLALYGLWQLDQRPVEVLAIWGLAQIVEFVRNGG